MKSPRNRIKAFYDIFLISISINCDSCQLLCYVLREEADIILICYVLLSANCYNYRAL